MELRVAPELMQAQGEHVLQPLTALRRVYAEYMRTVRMQSMHMRSKQMQSI